MEKLIAVAIAVMCISTIACAAEADWDPEAFRDEGTLTLRTVGPEEGEHWSTLWLVVIDDQIYIRLGSRAAGRIENNTAAPYVTVRIAGQTFDRVRAERTPEMVEGVADAMAEKYWSDILVRLFPHPLTIRLTPEAPAEEQGTGSGK